MDDGLTSQNQGDDIKYRSFQALEENDRRDECEEGEHDVIRGSYCNGSRVVSPLCGIGTLSLKTSAYPWLC